jgi:hypothetical protein
VPIKPEEAARRRREHEEQRAEKQRERARRREARERVQRRAEEERREEAAARMRWMHESRLVDRVVCGRCHEVVATDVPVSRSRAIFADHLLVCLGAQ